MVRILAAGLSVFLAIEAGSTSVRADDPVKGAADRAALGILARCVSCHRGDEAAGGLDLSRRELAIEGGETGPALIPGEPAKSLLLTKVTAKKMPPKEPLTASEIATLGDWIR